MRDKNAGAKFLKMGHTSLSTKLTVSRRMLTPQPLLLAVYSYIFVNVLCHL